MLGVHDEALLKAFSAEVLQRGGTLLRDGDRVVGLPPWTGSAVWVRLAGEDTVYGFGYAVRDLLPISDEYSTAFAIDILTAIMDGGASETFSAAGSPAGFEVKGRTTGAAGIAEGTDLVTIPVPAWGP
ncbi:MAG: hypothetical protein KF727_11260 [Microbacteriaceae bacterium]|nr:hypothetical protein [Microbacteriaceae bacterium]